MSDSKHTPGPWLFSWGSGAIFSDNCGDGVSPEIARMRATCVTPRWEADIRLIGAAPDLLAACREALESIHDLTSDVDPRSWPEVRRIEKHLRATLNAAIAKAEGAQ